ncbi:hypothetical protein [Mucisphaera calidilacus]|nr:hypothetical protein [Mucisphaera calidilacus]
MPVVLLCGCASDPTSDELPRLDEIRSSVTPPGPPEGVAVQGPSTTMGVVTVGVRIESDLERAWEKLSATGLDPRVVDAWAENGLRVGTLPSTEVVKWLSELPQPVWGMGRRRAMVTTGTAALLETRRLGRTTAITLGFTDPVQTRGPLSLRGVVRESGLGLGAALVPAKPRLRSYVTAAPSINELDRIELFDALALLVPTDGQTAVVISLTPQAMALVRHDAERTDEPVADPEPWLLGVPLLVRQRSGIIWQRIVVIRSESIRPGAGS